MPTDRQQLKEAQIVQIGSKPLSGEAVDAVGRAHSRVRSVQFNDADTANVVVAETPFAYVYNKSVVRSVKFTPNVAITAHDTNYATISVKKRTAGGSATTVASQTTKITGGSGDIATLTPISLTLSTTASDLVLAAGDTLTVTVAKAASGVKIANTTGFSVVDVVVEEI